MEQILEWDKTLLLFINSHTTHLLDYFFWFVSSKEAWIPFYLTLSYVIIKRQPKMALIFIIAIVLTIVLSDQISSTFFKNVFQRLRPSHEPSLEGIIKLLFNYKGGQYGFVSSHAANSFGLATFSALLFRNRTFSITILIWAFLLSYSRIYLGVHYPSDVLVGGLVGVLSAILIYKALKWFLNRDTFVNKWLNIKNPLKALFLRNDLEILLISLISSTLLILFASKVLIKSL